MFKDLRLIDWGMLVIVLILIAFGLFFIYTFDLGQNNNFFYFKKQLLFACLGLIVFFIFSLIDYRFWRDYSYWFYLSGLILLVVVLFWGTTIRGTRGWFSLGTFNFQPVEIVKIFLLLVLARFFSLKAYEIKSFQFISLSGLLLAPAILLVLAQPDLGSAIVLFMIWFGLLLVSGIKKSHFFLFVLFMVIAVWGAWFFLLAPYQKQRIITFLNPATDPLGSGYNVIQSTVAVGSGRLKGRGMSFGSQSQLKFLPEAHTDFIFASLAESLGFLGSALILFIYLVFFFYITRRLLSVKDDFAVFFSLGVLIYFAVQMFLNIAMNIGLAPVTGLPLPLISYGGSSLLSTMVMLGIISNILIAARKE